MERSQAASARTGLPVWIRGLIRTMRPRQWLKNGFIFIPLLFDRQFTHAAPLLRVAIGYVLFCMIASTVYLINDIVDVEKDKLHPKKKHRPIPAGQLPIPIAFAAAIVLPVVALSTAALLPAQGTTIPAGWPFGLILVAYLLLQIAYSFALKNMVIMDVLVIAGGFVLRVIGGVVIINVTNFSPWLYVCFGMLSLFLAVGKRRQELMLLAGAAKDHRATYKEYNLPLLDDMLRMVTTGSVLAYTLYTVEAQTKLASGPAMLLTIPFVVYGIFRYLYLIHVKGEGGAPDEVLFKDRPLLIDVIAFVVAVGAIIYLK
ncbi:MAG TPA: decaprenyl-phosphate phosphoribosyltransferase [Aggregatilineales bacterium]|nr:decaprenyl-phosphate phosphoribosyltransferase [Aggregatilineales bacterium]